MAGIDIFNLQPNVVSRDLRGKIITFYGAYKSGKTWNACKFPKPLLIAFEKGYSAIPGILVQPINKWTEFKKVLKQLDTEQGRQMFETIIIDTIDIAYQLCEDYICQREGVESISDIAWGKGYKLVRDEFFNALRKIALMDYGLVMISHAIEKQITLENGEHYTKVMSTLTDRAKDIVFGMSDIVGYAKVVKDKEGKNRIALYMRETPQFEAGSRWRYTPDVIEFTYENLVNALAEAVEKEEQASGVKATDEKVNMYKPITKYNFDEIMKEIKQVLNKLMEINENSASEITEIVENYLGKGKKVTQCTRDQVDIMALILDDLKDLLKQYEQ